MNVGVPNRTLEPPCRVLVVDDDPTQRLLVAEVLETPHYAVSVVASGAEALALAATHEFDLVLLDRHMPGLSGDETCRRLRRLPGLAGLPVLMLTGSTGAHDLAASLGAGANDCIRKPFLPLELQARVAAAALPRTPVSLHAPQPPAAPPPRPGARAIGPAAGVAPLAVWVVDDDPLVALYLGELLLDQGFVVTTFGDPNTALAAYEADPHGLDVLVTDQRMPALSGEELARAVLQRRPGVRVILCTGYSDAQIERRAQAIGIRHFFRKPFDARALLRAIRGEQGGGT